MTANVSNRIRKAEALARVLDDEPAHALQVYRNAMLLFDALTGLHKLDDEARDILAAAALLHDTGYRLGFARHHKNARKIIMEQDLPGFSDREKHMVACVARYHRKAHPQPGHKGYGELGDHDREVVRKLSALIRIADGLDRAHDASICGLAATVNETTVRIVLEQQRPSGTDVWGGMRKRGLFEEVFERSLEITAPGVDADLDLD